ncbi:hypothetical protein [Mycobacterium barrassiae]|nr:hypothetical protein [Mycobacterium barrassiae]
MTIDPLPDDGTTFVSIEDQQKQGPARHAAEDCLREAGTGPGA